MTKKCFVLRALGARRASFRPRACHAPLRSATLALVCVLSCSAPLLTPSPALTRRTASAPLFLRSAPRVLFASFPLRFDYGGLFKISVFIFGSRHASSAPLFFFDAFGVFVSLRPQSAFDLMPIFALISSLCFPCSFLDCRKLPHFLPIF